MKHGELFNGLAPDGYEYFSVRWCENHQTPHGTLYPCETYPQDVLDEIAQNNAQFIAMLADPEWVENNDPATVAIMRWFAEVN